MFDFNHSYIIQFRDMYKTFHNNDATKKAYRQGKYCNYLALRVIKDFIFSF